VYVCISKYGWLTSQHDNTPYIENYDGLNRLAGSRIRFVVSSREREKFNLRSRRLEEKV